MRGYNNWSFGHTAHNVDTKNENDDDTKNEKIV